MTRSSIVIGAIVFAGACAIASADCYRLVSLPGCDAATPHQFPVRPLAE